MEMYVLREGTLNDDELYLAPIGMTFKGGFVAFVEFYQFANEWGNNKITKRFKTYKQLEKFLSKRFPNFDQTIINLGD